jgi:hypothetical protein
VQIFISLDPAGVESRGCVYEYPWPRSLNGFIGDMTWAIASKIIAELEIIIESRAAIAMTTNGTTGAESYRKEVEYQVDLLGRALRILMNKVEKITPAGHRGTS